MKKIILLTLGIVFSMGVFAQAPAKGAVISWESKRFDFGDVKQGEKVTHIFKYKNIGSDTLKISSIFAYDGCTVTAYDKVVAPGASGSIAIEFNTTGKLGVVNNSLNLTSNSTTDRSPGDFLNIRVNVIQ